MAKSTLTVKGFFLVLGRFRTNDGARKKGQSKPAPAIELKNGVTCVAPNTTEIIPEVPEKKDPSVATPDLSGTPDSEVCCDCGPKDYNVPCCEPCSDDDDWADDDVSCCEPCSDDDDWADDDAPCCNSGAEDEEDDDDDDEDEGRLLRMGNHDARTLEASKLCLTRSSLEDTLKYLQDFLEKSHAKKSLLASQIEDEEADIERLEKTLSEARDRLFCLLMNRAKNEAEIATSMLGMEGLEKDILALDERIKEQAMNVIRISERGVSTPNDPSLMDDSGFEDVFHLLCGKEYAVEYPVATIQIVAKAIVAKKRVENPRLVWKFPEAEELYLKVTEEAEEILASED